MSTIEPGSEKGITFSVKLPPVLAARLTKYLKDHGDAAPSRNLVVKQALLAMLDEATGSKN